MRYPRYRPISNRSHRHLLSSCSAHRTHRSCHSFFVSLVLWLYVLIFFESLAGTASSDKALESFGTSQFGVVTVVAMMVCLGAMVADRVIYRLWTPPYVIDASNDTGLHNSRDEGIGCGCHMASGLRPFYALGCLYLYLSATQLRCGLPLVPREHPLTETGVARAVRGSVGVRSCARTYLNLSSCVLAIVCPISYTRHQSKCSVLCTQSRATICLIASLRSP